MPNAIRRRTGFWRRTGWPARGAATRTAALNVGRPSFLEPLEGRLLFAHFTWVGQSGSWSNAANWQATGGATGIPTAADTVTVNPTTPDGLPAVITLGTFASIKSGTIGNAEVRLQGASALFLHGELTLNGTVTVIGGGQFATRFVWNTPGTLNGTGVVRFEAGGGSVGPASSLHAFNIGPGITIRADTSGGTFGGGPTTSDATIVVNGGTLTFASTRFAQRGNVVINGGILRFSSPEWTNSGPITLAGGQFAPGGTYRQEAFDELIRAGGAVTLGGTLLGDLNLDARTGSFAINNANFRNGRLTLRDGATLTGGPRFDNYTIASDFAPTGGMTLANDLTLENARLRMAGVNLRFDSPVNRIRGDGVIEAVGGSFSLFGGQNQVVTFERGVAVRTASGNVSIGGNTLNQRVVLEGPLAVTASGQTFALSVHHLDVAGELSLVSGAVLQDQGGTSLNVLPGGSIVTGARTVFTLNRAFANRSEVPGRARAPGQFNVVGGTAAAPRLIEVAGQDRGLTPDGFRENFAMGVLRLNTSTAYARLVNDHDNSLGDEALYVDAVDVPGTTTLDLNGQTLYARAVEGGGQVINGTIRMIDDGGPLTFGVPVTGRVSAAGQQDAWSFYGRRGQVVSATVNGSPNPSASALAPVNPRLGAARLTLFAPDGGQVAFVQAASVSAAATLANVTLPEDGQYVLRAQASTATPSATGHYKLALYDVTVEVRPLELNRVVYGALETPFARDQWTFALSAGQQVQFDLLASETSGLLFTLVGPDGYVAFSDLAGDSPLVTIPPGRGGAYTLTVRGASDQSGAYSFMLRDTSVQELTIGADFAGLTPGTGAPRWFKVTLPRDGQLLLTLDDSADANRNQLFVRRGSVPTRERYDYRYHTYDADEQIFIPGATAGDWYVMLYPAHAPAPSQYTLRADYSDLRVTAVTPDRYGVGNTMTMTLTGGGFGLGTTVSLVGAGGAVIAATTAEVDSIDQVTATFNLAGAPLQKYDVRVERGGLAYTLPRAFEAVTNVPAGLSVKLHIPAFPARNTVSAGRVEYTNTGTVAMTAPLLILQGSDPEGDQFPILSLDMSRTVEDFWSATLPPGTSYRVMMLASGRVPGVLNPGESMSIPYNYLGEKGPLTDTDQTLELEVRCIDDHGPDHGEPDEPVDWSGLKSALRPAGMPEQVWDDVYQRLTQSMVTPQEYAAKLAESARYLGRLGVRVVDVDELWNFVVQQALGSITAFPTLSTSIDMQLPTPGEPPTISRRFDDGLVARNRTGAFGYGWSMPWTTTLTPAEGGNLVTVNSDGGGRLFVRDTRGGGPLAPSARYFSGAGDSSELRRVGANVFELRETDGVVTRFRADGKLDYVQDANGNRTTAQYDGGRFSGLLHSSGGSIAIAYNPAGRISALTSSTGDTVTYTYDAAGEHLLSVVAEDGSTITYTYESGGAAAAVRHALRTETAGGVTREFTYDSQGRVASSSLTGGAEAVTVSYNIGRVTLTTEAGASSIDFDHRLRPVRSTDALGRKMVMRYDDDNRLAGVIYPDGTSQKYAWCDCGSLMSVTDALGRTTRYDRDPVSRRITGITDPRGNVTRMTYDGKGNQVSQSPAVGAAVYAGSHTPSGLPQTFTNARGQTSTFVYNALGQVTRQTAADGVVTDYVYDSRGRVSTITVGNQTTTFAYDAADGDRLRRLTYPNGKFVQYAYDDFGRLVSTSDHSGYATGYEYDAAGRLRVVKDGAGNALTTYTYDAAGRRSRVDHANGTYTTYTFDAAGGVRSISHFRAGGALNSRFTYDYDDRGRRTGETNPDGRWTYSHDAAGQLTRSSFASVNPLVPDQDLRFAYDAAGNRTFVTTNGVLDDYASNSLNQYSSVTGVTYAYDAAGNLVFDGRRRYGYDTAGRLNRVETPGVVTEYEYNVFGARSATIVNGVRTEYLRAPGTLGDVLAEYDATGNLVARNVYGDTLLARTDEASGSLNFFDFDALGSTTGLSGAGGTYVNRYAYDPFGRALVSTEAVANPYGYVGIGGVRDGPDGLLQMGVRDYSVGLGRFTTPDPIGYAGDVNAYRYANNSPVMNVDASGLKGRSYRVPIRPNTTNTPKPFTPLPDEPSKLGDFVKGVAKDEFKERVFGDRTGWPTLDHVTDHVVDYLNPVPDPGDVLGKFLPGAGEALDLLLDPDVNQHHANAMCGLALQREFGTINIGAAKQLAALGGAGGGTVAAACLDGFPESGDEDMGLGDLCARGTRSMAPRPLDPNEKIPPAGVGPANHVPVGAPIEYTINFENLGPGSEDKDGNPYPVVAAAPAQRVAIGDQLGPALDPASVVFTAFSFGDTIVPVAPGEGAGGFFATVPATSGAVAFVVQIEAQVDVESGVLSVVFQAIDPATGLPPVPTVGVLAPENGTGNGKGYFKFSIRPAVGVADGTAIRNVAVIQFDANDVIPTNQVDPLDPTKGTDPALEALVTIDVNRPTSHVNPLGAVVAPGFLVRWQGQDGAGGSGVATYDVYVSVDGAPATLWLDDTALTESAYAGEAGRTYAFYSRATDLVGHEEDAPAAPDVTTTVSTSQPPPRVTDVFVSSTDWLPSFVGNVAARGLGDAAYGFRIGNGTDQLNELPWTNLDRVSVRFDRDVSAESDDLRIHGVNRADYAVAGFTYHQPTRTATWTLAGPIARDKLLLALDGGAAGVRAADGGAALDGEWTDAQTGGASGNGAAGGDFHFGIRVLPGDVDRNGSVQATDLAHARRRVAAAPAGVAYSVFHDVTGNNAIQMTDVLHIRNRIGTRLPAGIPTAPHAHHPATAADSASVPFSTTRIPFRPSAGTGLLDEDPRPLFG